MTSFAARLESYAQEVGSRVCVGLDLDRALLPDGVSRTERGIAAFLSKVIDATAPFAAAYKPNSAFYEALGREGLDLLGTLIDHIHDETGAPVILDIKRGDVGHTGAMYATAAFERFRADAVTVSPYLGRDGILPFLERPEKGAFVLARTSNPSAGEIQDLDVGGEPLYVAVARRVRAWDDSGRLGLVTGATYPGEIARIRTAVGDGMPFLVPGVGAQGGDAQRAAQAAADSTGGGFLINAGRSILYASPKEDGGAAAARAAESLRETIRAALQTA